MCVELCVELNTTKKELIVNSATKKELPINSLVAFSSTHSSTHMLRKPWTHKMSEKKGEKVQVCARD